MTFIVATNVIASRPPERRPTGTPHARANCRSENKWKWKLTGKMLCKKKFGLKKIGTYSILGLKS